MALRFGKAYTIQSEARRGVCDCLNDEFVLIMTTRNGNTQLWAQCTKCDRAHEIAGYGGSGQ